MAQVKEEKVDENQMWNMLKPLPTNHFCHQVLKPKQEHQDSLNLSLTLGTGNVDSAVPGTYLSLSRACSLPALPQHGRTLESGGRLMEKRSIRARCGKSYGADTMPNSPSKIPAWAAASAAKSPALCRAIVKLKAHNAHPQDAAQVSAANKTTGPSRKQVMLQDCVRKQTHPPKNPKLPKKNSCTASEADMIHGMPSVTTTGPGGKQIEGVLYMYRRNQVKIVCICHGWFLTPAEFVSHAGSGNDVENPMQHIKVRPAFF